MAQELLDKHLDGQAYNGLDWSRPIISAVLQIYHDCKFINYI